MLKKTFYPFIFIFFLVACDKEDDTDSTNTDKNPQTDKRDTYIGDYSVRDSLYLPIGGLEEVKFYTLHIEKHSSADSIIISNLADTSWSMTAAFYDTTFYVWGQFMDSSQNVYGSGGGFFIQDSLYMQISSWRYSHRIDGEKQ